MHLYEIKKNPPHSLLACAAVCLALLVLVMFAVFRTDALREQEQQDLLCNAVNQAVVNCYAIEGTYPASLAHLEQYYGLTVDQEKYLVTYEVFAENVRPNVRVQRKGGAQ